jgi:hypothetical protein
MSKVQEYLKRKKIEELGLPKLYIVKSSRDGVDKPVERQVVDIVETVGHRINDKGRTSIDRYKLENEYPYEVDIVKGETSNLDEGYGSGFGDLWGWSYFCSINKDEANQYYQKEYKRVNEKYLK